jgi:uncharacterized protein DUF1566
MKKMGRGLVVVLVTAAMCWGGSALAGQPKPPKPTKAQQCQADKNEAAGEKAECLAEEWAKQALGKTPNFAKCDDEFTRAFAKAESHAGPGVCPTEGDAATIEAVLDACMADVATALAGVPPGPACTSNSFPATGQTTSFTAGDDGAIQAGATLSYTDNGDGTITDNNTKLVWEKKSADGSINDRDTGYTWANAFAVHIVGLNAGGGFAGHTDWRLPNVKELQSIVNYGAFNPAVSPEFNTGCAASCTVLACSCTAAESYWSSSTVAANPAIAWNVDFVNGFVILNDKSDTLHVRAVRGGL